MPKAALIPVNNQQHKILTPPARDLTTSLRALAERYSRTQAARQAKGAIDAKWRALHINLPICPALTPYTMLTACTHDSSPTCISAIGFRWRSSAVVFGSTSAFA